MVKSDEGRKKERQIFKTNLGSTIFQLNYTIDGKILETFDLFKKSIVKEVSTLWYWNTIFTEKNEWFKDMNIGIG